MFRRYTNLSYLCSFNFLHCYVNIWAAFCTVLTIVAAEVKTVQKPVSGSNLFPVPASSEAGFSAPAPKLPHTGKQTEKRISASARADALACTSMYKPMREFAYRKLTALTGCQWFHAVSSYVNLQHPCCKLTCEFCKSKTSFLPNTPAIHGGTEQNSKQPNVHGCTFGCDGILGGSEYVPPCTLLNVEFAMQTRIARMHRTYILER